MLRCGFARRMRTTGFNPLPPWRVGDARIANQPVRGHEVSIRSHPGGWEMPRNTLDGTGGISVSIRSHPGGWEMRIEVGQVAHRYRVSIRSHPGGWEMRQTRGGLHRPPPSFNPLPPWRVGDAHWYLPGR